MVRVVWYGRHPLASGRNSATSVLGTPTPTLFPPAGKFGESWVGGSVRKLPRVPIHTRRSGGAPTDASTTTKRDEA